MKAFKITSVLHTTMRVWQQNFVAFTLLAAVMYGPMLVLQFLPSFDGEWIAYLALDVLIYTLVAAPITYGVIMELQGTRPSHLQCFRIGLAQLAPAFVVSLASATAVFGGLMLLVVPGLIVALMLWVVVPVAVVEKLGVRAALSRSRELTHGYKWPLFVILLIEWGASFGAPSMIDEMFEPTALAFVEVAIDAMIGVFGAIAAAVAYAHLREVKEGARVPELARAFAIVRK